MRAVVVSLAGPRLLAEEHDLLGRGQPAGVILFGRNCVDPRQLRELCDAVRIAAGDTDLPILIDQEGGRVMRLRPPRWRPLPAMGTIGRLASVDRQAGLEAARLAGALIGGDLSMAGITVDCAPVLDVSGPTTTKAIGDRAFASDPVLVGELGRALMTGLSSSGVAAVIKHLPGHGRAESDSHMELPVVTASLAALREHDFVPFKMCHDAKLAMTAHLLFKALDADRPATQSPAIISEIIRGEIGFAGILISDDLSMEALSGSLEERASLAVAAGCDLALYCHGRLSESTRILNEAPFMPSARAALWRQAVPAPSVALAPSTMLEADFERLQALLAIAA
ncbi:beta-N-acetylhexosaminidase [Arboricoccus pini]|uniref:beta-N-acetylhexosaminidase n=1 Tax=Arboricoccus pini TaxID=1963835 RepID=A0A212QQ63_9PROT|nr:beta-N-acetylhexosaminidase [Arboricoccus pini]SNB61550.1 beta-N-acetylhexosaminidase [Arboricoccus pini]